MQAAQYSKVTSLEMAELDCTLLVAKGWQVMVTCMQYGSKVFGTILLWQGIPKHKQPSAKSNPSKIKKILTAQSTVDIWHSIPSGTV